MIPAALSLLLLAGPDPTADDGPLYQSREFLHRLVKRLSSPAP